MLRQLEERSFPVAELRLLASERSASRTIEFRGQALPVEAVSAAGFAGLDLALFACTNDVAKVWSPVARAAGVRVVDNSSAFRYDDDVPLIVPEVNGDRIPAQATLVANPNCSTIAIVVALAPLARTLGLERVVVSTYQSVSGAGSEALAELERGVRAGLEGAPPRRADGGAPFAFNVVPHIDRFEANGYSREEMKLVWESRKILGLPDLAMTTTAVRVPVRVGHGAALNVTLARACTPEEARALWRTSPGVTVMDEPERNRYPTPLEAEGRDDVLIGRIRSDLSHPRGLDFFITSDNLRKGAATNAVQIAELLLRAAPSGTAAVASGRAGGARP
jgi:aspartate-semialdehyde dehydrogenase